jgi:WD40 repeat protein
MVKSGKVLVFVLLSAVMVLAGCGESTPVTLSDIPNPTVTPRPTYLPTITPYYSSPMPITSTPYLAITATQIIEAATNAARSTQLAAFPVFPTGCDNRYPFSVSADGEWIADVECYLPDSTLVVMNKSGTLHWEIHYNDYSYLPDYGYVYIEHWSNDSRYLYFSTAYFGDGGYCFVGYDDGGFGLFRLDVQTGIIATILPLRRSEYKQYYKQYVWSFSPTGRRFIYEQSKNTVGIWDLYTGEITSVLQLPENNIRAGGFLWSQDGLQIIYTVAWLDNNERYHSKLYLTDLTTNSTYILMTPPDEKCIWAPSWAEKAVLNIEIVDDNNFESYRIVFDTNSNQIIGTPIPTPTL